MYFWLHLRALQLHSQDTDVTTLRTSPSATVSSQAQANHMQQFMHYSSIQSWELAVSPSMTDTVATIVARDTGQLSQVRLTTYPYVPMHAQNKDFQLRTLTLKNCIIAVDYWEKMYFSCRKISHSLEFGEQ